MVVFLCFCSGVVVCFGGVVVIGFLCGCVSVVVFLWCGCAFVFVFLWLCFCGGVVVCFGGVVVFSCFCDCFLCGGVVEFLRLCFCGGVFPQIAIAVGVLTSNRGGGRRTTLADWTWQQGAIAGCSGRGAIPRGHCQVLL